MQNKKLYDTKNQLNHTPTEKKNKPQQKYLLYIQLVFSKVWMKKP